ncbi:hypothetical protein JDV02_001947 [Purpureocillium takamizusanense]|uniref:Rhodopsin domain-containing protein n=1 Tax=Purpureocillium takamizusanense TaxID=2060973 RepID=A0A9Q8QAR3_9HYPO|nr:uncharacterized protein JDV02_001947 [Purpureocillium takamizusanense]UNI15412.1 hypothetical protein JDV02_001947 [Purpureocillium takamizusanense]
MHVSLDNLRPSAAEDQGPALWTTVTTFTVLAQVAVVGRLCARRLKGVSLAADDYLICLAQVQSWTLFGLFVGLRQHGLGKHRSTVPVPFLTTFYRFLYYYQIVYSITPPTIKLSLVFLYARLFPSPRFRTLLWLTGVIVAVWGVASMFISVFACDPIEAFWTRQGKCMRLRTFGIAYSIINIITDFAVWLMPIPAMWRVQLPLGQKIALSVIFLLGLFDCGAALGRPLSMLAHQNQDYTWEFSNGVKWAIIEICIGIICTCLPAMRTLLSFAWACRFGRTYSHDHTGMSRHSRTVRSATRPNTSDCNNPATHTRGYRGSDDYPSCDDGGDDGHSTGDERCLTTDWKKTRVSSDGGVELGSIKKEEAT